MTTFVWCKLFVMNALCNNCLSSSDFKLLARLKQLKHCIAAICTFFLQKNMLPPLSKERKKTRSTKRFFPTRFKKLVNILRIPCDKHLSAANGQYILFYSAINNLQNKEPCRVQLAMKSLQRFCPSDAVEITAIRF